ncbi:phage baseplate protein [Serratia marcescens]|uniref:phage baseplate protein n=1 Tax=Serratia marcescens TaxID=615 RepID=UPI001D146E97|nr:hypothetical protein [Serratia marcescens]
MPIIKKPDYNIFASEAKTGEIVDFPNLLRGWGVTLDQTAGKPPMEWFNALQKRTDEWLTYLSQRGLPEWQNTLDYPKDAVVQFGGKFYVSKKNTKNAQPDRSQNDWAVMLGSAASRDVGTAKGQVMEVGTAGLGVGPIAKNDAYSTLAQFYRIDDKAANKPPINGTSVGVVSLPIDGAPSTGYLAVSIQGDAWVGRSTTASNGVTWYRVYTTAYKPTPSDIGAAKITGDTGQKFWVQSAPGDVNSAVPVSLLNSELQKQAKALISTIYPVGIVAWFAQNKNPNQLFPGTTWKYIGENRTVRLAKQDGSDLLQTGGADSVTLTNGNMPAHNHSFHADTSWFDYGSKWTSQEGLHAHNIGMNFGDAAAGGSGPASVKTADKYTSTDGLHSHKLDIGGHSHSVSGTTGSSGGGAAFSIVNPYVKLMGWYRSA